MATDDSLQHQNETSLLTTKAMELLEFFSKKYTVEIVKVLERYGSMRFSEIMAHFEMSTKTMTRRLKMLEHYGFVQRVQHATIPPKVEYTILRSSTQICSLLQHVNDMNIEHPKHPSVTTLE